MKKLGFVLIALLIQGCVKETKIIEREIVPERLAPRDITDSLQVKSNTEIEIKKAALKKAFLLLPNIKTGGRTPQWNDFKGVIVSFERSGNQLGLFKLTTNNLYSDIPTDNLIQTFPIIKEDDLSMKIDFSKGLQSLVLEPNYEVIMNGKSLKGRITELSKDEDAAVEMKDVFLKSIELKGDRLVLDQVSRIVDERKTPQGSQKKEFSGTLRVEMRPYIPSATFKPLLFDKDQKIGSFLNLATKQGQDNPLPYAMKWDISPEAGPIKLVVAENTPQEIQQTIFESGEYWNRAFGRKVFEGIIRGTSGDLPNEREMIVRWINWESAGFAYASAQPDPLTGEILRAQVFLTSSWYNYAKGVMAKGVRYDQEMPEFIKRSVLCVLDQEQMKVESLLRATTESHRAKVAQDVIRDVVTHEMGHAIGMRHNFAGSLMASITDKDKIKVIKDYTQNENHQGAAVSTSVMDYTDMLTTAINGAYLKQSVLSYDQQFVNWSYLGRPIEIQKYQYCSDEHIAMANEENKSIYGCERFDDFQNPLLGYLYQIRKDGGNSVFSTWSRLMKSLASPNLYAPMKKPDFSFRIDYMDLNPILFSPNGLNFNPLVSLKAAVDSSVKDSLEDDVTGLSEKLSKDIKEVGGVLGIMKWLSPSENQKGRFFQDQVTKLFEEIKFSDYPQITEAQFEEYKKEMMAGAKKADKELIRNMLTFILPLDSFRYQIPDGVLNPPNTPSTTPKKTFHLQFKYRTELNVTEADLKALFKMVRDNIVDRLETKKVKVYGKDIEIRPIENLYTAFMFMAPGAYKPENYQEPLKSKTDLFKEEKILLKAELVQNVLKVLTAAEKQPKEIDQTELSAAVNSLDETQLSGITKAELISELAVLTYFADAPKPKDGDK